VNRFVADFIGETNWLPGEITFASSGGVVVKTEFGAFQSTAPTVCKVGEKVWVGFRPEAVRIGGDEQNHLGATVRHVSYLGEIEQYELELSSSVRIKAFEQNPIEVRPIGGTLAIHVRPADVLVLPTSAV
jgi:spermidine/putrescine transport system ATP-binding protein